MGVCVDVLGHADPPGSEPYNMKLSERRAAYVADRLAAAGIGLSRVDPIGLGAAAAGDGKARSVTFRLRLDEGGGPVDCGAGS
jgi:outer membrane protein OmpA-like peptidoglycan-associated protein